MLSVFFSLQGNRIIDAVVMTTEDRDRVGQAVDISALGGLGMETPGGPMPMETSVVVELEDLDGSTKMVMPHVGVPAESPGGQGWNMAIDKLEARVAELTA